MAIKDCKITDTGMNEYGIAAAPDKLEGSAEENKALFDRLVRQVVALQFNTLLEELLASTAAGQLGMEAVGGLAAETVQEGFRLAAEALAQRICKVEGSVKGRLPVLQEDGALQDGGVLLEDVLLRLVSAKVGNIPAFDSVGKLKDSGVNVEDLLEVETAAEASAEAAARSAEIAREIAGGDVAARSELEEAVAEQDEKLKTAVEEQDEKLKTAVEEQDKKLETAVKDLEKKDTFVATKDVTAWEELEVARNAGKDIVLHWKNGADEHYMPLGMYDDATDTSDNVCVYLFRAPTGKGGVKTVRCIKYENGEISWTEETVYPTPASIGAAPAYSYGTSDLKAGSTSLTTGKMHLVYE